MKADMQAIDIEAGVLHALEYIMQSLSLRLSSHDELLPCQ